MRYFIAQCQEVAKECMKMDLKWTHLKGHVWLDGEGFQVKLVTVPNQLRGIERKSVLYLGPGAGLRKDADSIQRCILERNLVCKKVGRPLR